MQALAGGRTNRVISTQSRGLLHWAVGLQQRRRRLFVQKPGRGRDTTLASERDPRPGRDSARAVHIGGVPVTEQYSLVGGITWCVNRHTARCTSPVQYNTTTAFIARSWSAGGRI